jgi:hypothetical protein
MQLNSDDDDRFFFRLEFDKNLDITSNDYLYLKSLRYLSYDEKRKVEYFENNLNQHFVKIPEKGIQTIYYNNDI